MARVFQPKIIIGSVVGFIATAIGVIAVFFPSLFNMETKKIADYTHSLNTLQDANNFVEFLKKHQNSIVRLDITYTEKLRYRYARNAKGEILSTDDENDNDAEYSEYGDRPKIDRLNDICSHQELEGKESFGAVDTEGHIFINSEFKCMPFLKDFNFLRKKGEIGIWIPGNNKGEDPDDSNYRIVITEASKNNSLFKWSIKDREKNSDEMQLSGTFFVNNFIDSHESDYGSDKGSVQTIYAMSPQWRAMNAGRDQIGIENITVIELEPLSKKEIESKNY